MTGVVVDTSALLAILFAEPDADRLVRALREAPLRRIGAPTFVEAAAVVRARKGPAAELALEALLHRLDIHIADFTAEAADRARHVWARHGRAAGPAGLNYGDCLAAGLALALGAPLLAKGDDFPRTDLPLADY